MLFRNYAIPQNAKIKQFRFRTHHPDTHALIPCIPALSIYSTKFFRPVLYGNDCSMATDIFLSHDSTASITVEAVIRGSLKPPCNHHGWHLANEKQKKGVAS